jgi:hypothetical protein
VVPEKVTIEAPQSVAIDFVAALPAVTDRQMQAAECCEVLSSLPEVAPPLRTHLRHQVLLN